MPHRQTAAEKSTRATEFARAVALGVGDLLLDDLDPASVARLFGLSGWMLKDSVTREEAYEGLAALRHSLLEVSGLDQRLEPVPLRTGDPKASLRIMAIYLDGLVSRAAGALDQAREQVLAAAVTRLRGCNRA